MHSASHSRSYWPWACRVGTGGFPHGLRTGLDLPRGKPPAAFDPSRLTPSVTGLGMRFPSQHFDFPSPSVARSSSVGKPPLSRLALTSWVGFLSLTTGPAVPPHHGIAGGVSPRMAKAPRCLLPIQTPGCPSP